MPAAVLVIADLLVIGGLTILTLGLVGLWRFPDIYARIHATAKVSSLGLAAVLLASIATGDGPLVVRALLIAGFLLLTAPVSSHVIAHAAYRRDLRAKSTEGLAAEAGERGGAGADETRPGS